MLTTQEKQRLEELTALKKKSKLNEKDFAEYKALMQKSTKGSSRKGSASTGFDPGNDFAWWSKIPELIRDSSNFKSNYVAGKAIADPLIPYVVPGVYEIRLYTCYNPGSEPTDPINVWARDLYLKMFQKYRPASGYSASDLGITLLAALEVVKLIAMYERIYGVINRWSVMNTNMPIIEAEALGLSVAQVSYLQGHMSDFRYDLNYLIRKAQRICIPKDIALINDAISLLGFEYIDHNNPRGQIIVYNLYNYGIYSDTALTTGGSISYQADLQTNLFDFSADNMCKALSTVENALLGSDSVQRIFADLTVWFGGEAMLQFLPVPEDFVILPVESKSILHKMHNMETMPRPYDASGVMQSVNLVGWARNGLVTADEIAVLNGLYNVYQYNDAIVTVGALKDANAGTPVNAPSNGIPGKTLEGTTALTGMGVTHIADGYEIDIDHEFVTEASLHKYNSRPVGYSDAKAIMVTSCVNWLVISEALHTNGAISTNLSNVNPVTVSNAAASVALIDWAPLSYLVTQSGYDTIVSTIYGDLDVVVPLSGVELEKLHRTCILSGLKTDVPVKS